MGVVDSELADDKFVPTIQHNILHISNIHRMARSLKMRSEQVTELTK